MDLVFLLGRILFVPLFVLSGLGFHFTQQAVEYARANGGPAPELTVPLSGVAMIAGAISVALGLWADLGALVLVATLVPVTYYMHAFWRVDDPQERQMQQTNFFKNVGLIGGALIIFWLYAEAVDLPLSLTDGVF